MTFMELAAACPAAMRQVICVTDLVVAQIRPCSALFTLYCSWRGPGSLVSVHIPHMDLRYGRCEDWSEFPWLLSLSCENGGGGLLVLAETLLKSSTKPRAWATIIWYCLISRAVKPF